MKTLLILLLALITAFASAAPMHRPYRKPLKPAHVDSFRDHRVAMSLAIAGMTCGPDETEPTVIDSAESIAVTYPTFVDDFTRLGAGFYVV